MVKSHSHWSKLGETGTTLGIKILLLANKVFGHWGFRIFLYPVITYYYLSQSMARQASIDYLQKIRPFLELEQRRDLSSFKHFLMFGEILLDKFLVWMGEIHLEDIVFEDPSIFKEIAEGKKGGVIIVSHLGNMEICSALVQKFPDLQLTILGFTRHSEKFNSLINKASNSVRVEQLQVTEITPAVAIRLSERVEEGGYIVIAGDRTPVTGQNRVSEVSFLGKNAAFPQGAFILGGLLKCPVYLMFCLKKKKHYHIYLELFSKQLKFARKERQYYVTEAVQSYAHRLEHYCVKAPLQWFNFYPFWQRQSTGNE